MAVIPHTLKPGQIITARKLRDENSLLKRKDLKLVEARDAIPATSQQVLQGITRAALADTKLHVSSLLPGNHKSSE